jgi:hypothetical protein
LKEADGVDPAVLILKQRLKAHLIMTASTRNIILKSLVQKEMNASRLSPPATPTTTAKKPRRDSDAWFVVTTDGSTRTISCKSPKSFESDALAQGVGAELPEARKKSGSETGPAREPGVDLSHLGVEKETTSKLIAGIHALPQDESSPSMRHEIAMPSTVTDLREMFKTDCVCMVNAQKKTH